ncbi:unnamed protein product [Withania somnifera]
MLIGAGLILFPTATKSFRRMWAFQSVLLLSIVMIFSIYSSIRQINSSSFYQYVWSWIINNDFSLDFGYLIDPLTSIIDNYMAHDQGYLRFFAYMSFFGTSMLGLVTSSNLIQIYIFWELVGPCSYLLIGFWFTRPVAANACQKAFVTNRVGDFGLLLGILGKFFICYFMSLFSYLPVRLLNPPNSPFMYGYSDAMEGPTPISALIHATTMVAAGIFLVARLLPLFAVIPYIMYLISVIGIITVLLGATLALSQKDIKRGLAYSTMSQLGYMMLALGMGSYRNALFHLITHAYSKALLFLGSGSIIHSMETIVGYSPAKSTLSLCGIPPLACFWSKDEILNDSRLYSPIFAIIAWATEGLTAFYMFRIYLLTFEGHLNVHFQNYGGKHKTPFYSLSLWGKNGVKKNSCLLTMNNNESTYFFSKTKYPIDKNGRKMTRPFMTIAHFEHKAVYSYPYESDNTMLFPIFVLGLFTLGGNLDILSKWLAPSINLLHQKSNNSMDWDEFLKDVVLSVGIAYFGIFIASLLYKPIYSSLKNFELINSFVKKGPKRITWDKIINGIYDWSYNRAYIDAFYTRFFVGGIRGLAEFTHFFDRRIIDGMTNGVGVISFIVGEGIKYIGADASLLIFSCI